MGNGNLLIGTGQGDATIWNPQVPIQNFNTLLQQKQAKEQADANALAAELSKVKTDGLRNDADRQSFFKQYQAIKDQAIANQYERDPLKRAMAKVKTKDALLGLQDFVNRSKQQDADEHSIMTKIYDPMQRHNYTDTSVNDMLANRQLSIDDPNYKKDLSFLQRQVDHSKVDAALTKMHQTALTKTPWSNPIQDGGPVVQGNKKGVITYQNRALTPEQILANDAHMYDVSNDLKQSLEQRYGNIQGENPDETKMLRIRQAAIDRGDLKEGDNGSLISNVKAEQNRKFNPDRAPDNYYAHRLFMIDHPSGTSGMQTPAQTLIAGDPAHGIAGMQQGGAGTGEKFISLAPKGQYGTKAPAINIDNNTGEHVFSFPDQVVPDRKAIAANKVLRDRYAKSPEKEGGVLGIGGTPIPFEKSKMATKLKPEVIIKKPSKEYRLNPNSPDYLAQAAEMAKEQNINLSQLNQIEGKKGNRGQIPQAVSTTHVNPVNTHKKAASDYGL